MSSVLHSEIVPAALEVLQRSGAPLSLDQLRKQLTGPFRVTPKQKSSFLDLLKGDSRVYAWPGSGKTARFWHRDPRHFAASAALEIASQGPLETSSLVRALVKAAHKYPRDAANSLIVQLVREGRLYEDPPWGRKRKLSGTRPDPERYRAQLEDELKPVLEKYAALGITPQRLVDQICTRRSGGVAEQIMSALDRIEPRKGLVVAAAKIRHAPEFDRVGKADFDAAAMQLFADRRVFLHDHTAPHTLTTAGREDLIADGKGRYYVGIAWRDPQHDTGWNS